MGPSPTSSMTPSRSLSATPATIRGHSRQSGDSLTIESPVARVSRRLHPHLRLARAPEVDSVWSFEEIIRCLVLSLRAPSIFDALVYSLFAFVFSPASLNVAMCFDSVRATSKSGRSAARRIPPVRLPSHGRANVFVLRALDLCTMCFRLQVDV